MKAKKNTTTHFAKKTGDKIFVELEITGNPDKVVEVIMLSILKNKDLFDGAKVSQLLFRGTSIENLVHGATAKSIQAIKDALQEIQDNLKI